MDLASLIYNFLQSQQSTQNSNYSHYLSAADVTLRFGTPAAYEEELVRLAHRESNRLNETLLTYNIDVLIPKGCSGYKVAIRNLPACVSNLRILQILHTCGNVTEYKVETNASTAVKDYSLVFETREAAYKAVMTVNTLAIYGVQQLAVFVVDQPLI